MDDAKKKRLEEAGWTVGSTEDFLEDSIDAQLKEALSKAVLDGVEEALENIVQRLDDVTAAARRIIAEEDRLGELMSLDDYIEEREKREPGFRKLVEETPSSDTDD